MTQPPSGVNYPGPEPDRGPQQDSYNQMGQNADTRSSQRDGAGRIKAFRSLKFGLRALARNFGTWVAGVLVIPVAIGVMASILGALVFSIGKDSAFGAVLFTLAVSAAAAAGGSLITNQTLKEVEGLRPGFREFLRPRHFWGPFVLSMIFSLPTIFSGGAAPETHSSSTIGNDFDSGSRLDSFDSDWDPSSSVSPSTPFTSDPFQGEPVSYHTAAHPVSASGGAQHALDLFNMSGAVFTLFLMGFLVVAIIMLVISAFLMFWPYALADGLKPVEAIKRATEAARRNLGQVLLYQLIPFVLLMAMLLLHLTLFGRVFTGLFFGLGTGEGLNDVFSGTGLLMIVLDVLLFFFMVVAVILLAPAYEIGKAHMYREATEGPIGEPKS